VSDRERRLGIIVPFDFALDREYWQFVPADVSVHITRGPKFDGPVGIELARVVADPAEAAAATDTLVAIEPDALVYACTSGSFVNGLAGEAALRSAMTDASGGTPSVTTSGGLLEALRALGVRRVGLGTPYVSELGQLLADFIEEAGFEPVALANLEKEEDIAGIGASEVVRLAEAASSPRAEAIFLSCTNLATFDVLPTLERRFGIPVLSANQVTMWAALRAAGAAMPAFDQALYRATAGSARVASG
jgi:maleate isomerase